MTDLSPERSSQLRAVLARACEHAELRVDPASATLLKYTNNAVYQLAELPMVVRIGVGPTGIARAPRIVNVARWLAERNAPVTRLVEDIAQPYYDRHEFAATFWHALPRRPASTPWLGTDLAAALKPIHALDADIDSAVDLPRWDPFTAAQRRLAAADPALPAADLTWLHEQWDHAADQYQHLPTPQIGLVHGDAHAGNLLMPGPGGRTPVLADLDSSGIGPISWDLAVPALDGIRFAETDFNRDFAEAYGRDVTQSAEWPVLRRIRELLLVTSAIPDLSRRPAIAAQHAYRLRTLQAGDTKTVWKGFQ
jgi:hypothetical protein